MFSANSASTTRGASSTLKSQPPSRPARFSVRETLDSSRADMEATVTFEVKRQANRIWCSVKVNGHAALVDRFEDFAELDERMEARLGMLWCEFRHDVRMECES